MDAVVDKVSLDLSARRWRRSRTLRDGDRVSAGGVVESVQAVVPIERRRTGTPGRRRSTKPGLLRGAGT